MSDPERHSPEQPTEEILDPRHFYAAYTFDQADERVQDIGTIIGKAHELDYPVRYWWLSDAMELQGFPDRLIVCVHHSSTSEDAGMDLYDGLREKEITWDDLEAAAVDEYRYLGNPVFELGDVRSPYGNWLFPDAVAEEKRFNPPEDALLMITPEDVRDELGERLGREVDDAELSAVLIYFRKALEQMDWTFYLDEALSKSVEERQKRWNEEETENKTLNNASPGSESEPKISAGI